MQHYSALTQAKYYYAVCEHGNIGTGPQQVLAATLTLSQLEGVDYAHPILMPSPSFKKPKVRLLFKYAIIGRKTEIKIAHAIDMKHQWYLAYFY